MSDDPLGKSLTLINGGFNELSTAGHITVIALIIILAFIHAVFVMAESALQDVNEAYIKRLAQSGNKRAIRLDKMLSSPERPVSAIKMCIALCGFSASAIAVLVYTRYLSGLLAFLPFGSLAVYIISAVIIIIALTFLFLIFGELIPKRMSLQKADSVALKTSFAVKAASCVLSPFISAAQCITKLVLKMFGFDPNTMQIPATEEELLLMMDESEEKGLIEESTKDMIENIFDFDDITVGEIMTHRTEMVAIEDTDTISEVITAAVDSGYSRLPVYHEDLDDIIGVVCVKDLLKYVCLDAPSKLSIKDIMRRIMFAPKTKPCSELFHEMTEKKMQLAIVVDEYGGTEGLITLEDLLEIIVGSIQDEYDNEEAEFTKVSDNIFTVDGTLSVDDLAEMLEVNLPDTESETVAGLFMEYLGRIPENSECPTVDINGISFTADGVADRRIERIIVNLK